MKKRPHKTKPKPQQLSQPQEQIDAGPSAGNAGREKAQAQNDSPAPVAAPVVVRQVKAAETVDSASPGRAQRQTDPKANEKWMTRFTGLIFAVTAIYAAVSVLQYRTMGKQLQAMQTQTDSMQEQLRMTQYQLRPYVAISNISLKRLEAEKQIVIDVTFANEGNTPAIGLKLTEVMFSVGPEPRTKFSDFTVILGAEIPTILPHKSETLTLYSNYILTKAQVDDITKKRLWLSVYGKGEYSGLGGPYPVGYCSVFLQETGFNTCQDYLHLLQ